MVALQQNYRDYLRIAFERRAKTKARYSLNAFAKDLELAPSRLSEVFSGKQGLSREKAAKIAHLLGLSPEDTEQFCDLVEMEHGRSAENRRLAKIRLDQRNADTSYFTLQADAFHLISDWYHFAVLQLLELPSFRYDARWIASVLGISRAEAEGALSRLLRLEVIEEKQGTLRKTKDFVASTDGVSSAAIRKFHSQILQKALDAIDCQPMESRNFSANYLTIDKANLPRAKEMVKRFRRRFVSQLSGEIAANNGVYCLSMQLFELTRNLEKK